ncbi:MAG: helix-turn-helix domain-containing protein, partial [Ktedonobacteraceae bacterium]
MLNYDTDSFGDLVRAFRKRARLTQQQLAEKIGMHRHAVSRWEQGEVLPASKALVLEIARCLHLNDAEMRLFLEASLTAPAPLWAVPLPRNLLFVGRTEVLEVLHTHLRIEPGGTSPQAVALHGLAGVGKTQMVLEYAYRHALDYTATFWINAETEESVLGSFATLARLLKLPAQLIHKQEDVVALVLNWLSAHRDWLLVFDNVEERELVARFVPSSRNGSLLFTTRFPTLGTLAASLELQPLSTEESMRLLLRRAENHLLSQPSGFIDAEEERAAQAIAAALDGLPLALDQAAAYIYESHCRFGDFLALFQHDALQVLQEHASSAAYPRSVEKTFTLAFERLHQQNPVAADLLTACCFLAPDEIPEELLRKGAAHLSEPLQTVLSDPFQLNAVLRDVLAHGLLHRNARTTTLTVHRLVQVVFKEKTTLAVQYTWIERLVCLL